MDITIRQIQCFLQVASLGSFTRAAGKLHTAQPGQPRPPDYDTVAGLRGDGSTTLLLMGMSGHKSCRPRPDGTGASMP
jgi:hypothetical protein